MDEYLGIKIIEIGGDFIRGTMPVDHRTHQPTGRLHGGANLVLAESLGSVGASLCTDQSKYLCFGQEINANHLRGASSGIVTGTARPIYRGRTSHVWQTMIEDERGRLTCISRLTVAVVKR
jgi:1,4-dihydroxy-2-naphthoyl-CoA hydrolase